MRKMWKNPKCDKKHIVIPTHIAADVQRLAILLDHQDHRLLRLLDDIADEAK